MSDLFAGPRPSSLSRGPFDKPKGRALTGLVLTAGVDA
jgi:hypothetical protein